ncbi:hypothetical protein BDY19DRAFT_997244 [Irpex rosettiformis]|uniref:Uncharacterized protein n=1 Tax=Irpex rosettiformis TaxID=378272 RepID=A0ACB8TSG8_9APHY|nr:hypothetical protein BDY19DRAFT_997244 [Irpex rosettiformis]
MAKKYATSHSVRKSIVSPIARTSRYVNRPGQAVDRVMGPGALKDEKEETSERIRQILTGCSESTLSTLQNNTVQDPSRNGFIIDVNFDLNKKKADWEDMQPENMLPPNLQADEAFIHALRDISIHRKRSR